MSAKDEHIYSHAPVLLAESISALNLKPGGVYVDGTFGRGGHSRAILQAMAESCKLFAFDRDVQAVAEAKTIDDPRFHIIHAPFSAMQDELKRLSVVQVDGILLDLGVSSPQLDEAERGFSFMRDGPLDMRMDQTRGESAAQWLASATEQEIREVLENYAEERNAGLIARAIATTRQSAPLTRTHALAHLVAETIRTRERGQHPATRTFQAVRIHVNRELEELTQVLPQALHLLAPLGRLAVISFHSLEDRPVKRFIQAQCAPEQLLSRELMRLGVKSEAVATMRKVGKDVVAGAVELASNPRARSARLRVAEKLGAV